MSNISIKTISSTSISSQDSNTFEYVYTSGELYKFVKMNLTTKDALAYIYEKSPLLISAMRSAPVINALNQKELTIEDLQCLQGKTFQQEFIDKISSGKIKSKLIKELLKELIHKEKEAANESLFSFEGITKNSKPNHSINVAQSPSRFPESAPTSLEATAATTLFAVPHSPSEQLKIYDPEDTNFFLEAIRDKYDYQRVLHIETAIQKYKSEKFKTHRNRFLDINPDINVTDSDNKNQNALMLAVCNNDIEVVELFIVNGPINLKCIDDNGDTAFSLAADRGYTEIIKLLLDNDTDDDTDISRLNKDYSSALMLATYKAHTETVQVILEHMTTEEIAKEKESDPILWESPWKEIIETALNNKKENLAQTAAIETPSINEAAHRNNSVKRKSAFLSRTQSTERDGNSLPRLKKSMRWKNESLSKKI